MPRKQAAFTRESALAYLSSNPNFPQQELKKPLSELSTGQLTRYARTLQKAEQEGRSFSIKEGRGHHLNPIHKIDPKRKEEHKRLAAQYSVGDENNPPSVPDVQRLVKQIDQARKRLRKPSTTYVIAVQGILKKSGICEERTLMIKANKDFLSRAFTRFSDDILAFVNFLFGYPGVIPPDCEEGEGEGWIEVWRVSILVEGARYAQAA